MPLTANDKDPSSKQVLAGFGAPGNNAVAEVPAFAGIVAAAAEHEDQRDAVQHKACDLDVLVEAGAEVVVGMELGPGAVVLVLGDIHSALHSACPHSVADNHLAVASEVEVFASPLAFPQPARPLSAFVDLCHLKRV